MAVRSFGLPCRKEENKMMDYKMFKEIVAEQFLNYLPEEFKDYHLRIREIKKINQTLDGLYLSSSASPKPEIVPTIYVNHMYEDYLESGNLQKVMEHAADNWITAYRDMPADIGNFNLSGTDRKIIMALVNTEQNKELLENVPHREFCDLSIVYRLFVGMDEGEMKSALINDSVAQRIGMTEQQLYEAAVVNTKELFPPTIINMDVILKEILVSEGMDADLAEMILHATAPENLMYVISNDHKINGAVSMLYENELHDFAEDLGTDLYLLPSSIHEIIAVPKAAGSPEELAQMVETINMKEVSVEERLSNQVYYYDRDLRSIQHELVY